MSERRQATERRILAAAAGLLARNGVAGLGVNVLAREAGIGKPLIYRYFGGLQGVIAALAADPALWLGEEDLLDRLKATNPAQGYGAFLGQMLAAYGEALRGSALTRELLRWETQGGAAEGVDLDAARGEAARQLIADLAHEQTPPDMADPGALTAVLLAAAQYLSLRGGDFAGFDLEDPGDRARLDKALARLAETAFTAPAAAPGSAPQPPPEE